MVGNHAILLCCASGIRLPALVLSLWSPESIRAYTVRCTKDTGARPATGNRHAHWPSNDQTGIQVKQTVHIHEVRETDCSRCQNAVHWCKPAQHLLQVSSVEVIGS